MAMAKPGDLNTDQRSITNKDINEAKDELHSILQYPLVNAFNGIVLGKQYPTDSHHFHEAFKSPVTQRAAYVSDYGRPPPPGWQPNVQDRGVMGITPIDPMHTLSEGIVKYCCKSFLIRLEGGNRRCCLLDVWHVPANVAF